MLLKNKSDIEEGSDREAVSSPGVSKTTVTQEIESDSTLESHRNTNIILFFLSLGWRERYSILFYTLLSNHNVTSNAFL